MKKHIPQPDCESIPPTSSVLDQILREGAKRLLQAALEVEIQDHLDRYQHLVDAQGHREVVRNGHHPERVILAGAGPIPIKQPRVDDRALEARGLPRFTSAVLPKFLRRAPSLDNLIPVLYLQGVSTDDFTEALESILGPDAKGLSANTVVRLKEVWTVEYEQWTKRDLTGSNYVYVWVDGVYSNARLEGERN